MQMRPRDLIAGAGLVVIYVMAGRFGLSLAFVNPSASPVWPPTGIALAMLLLLGYRYWPVVAIGALTVNLMTGTEAVVSTAIAAGNTLEAVSGAWLVNRFANGRNAFASARGVFGFTVLGALLAPSFSATIGVTSLALGSAAAWSDYGRVWVTWWLGDAAGALLVAPAIILWTADRSFGFDLKRGIELLLLFGVNVAVGLFVFGDPGLPGAWQNPQSFLCLPPLMWAAFRFGPRETIAVTLIVAAIAISGTVHGHGPFSYGTPNEALLMLQAFMAVVTTFALACAAVVAERRRADEARAQRLVFEETARRRAEELNQARDRFLATISHELRTPLNDMLSWIVLARSDPADSATIQRALEVFQRNIRHEIRLIEDLLDVSHMTAGRFQLELRPTALRQVIDAALDAIRPALESGKLRLSCTLEDVTVRGDADRLKQVVGNLLSNAVKFTPEGGEITVSLRAEEGEAVILVGDSGPGVDPDFAPYLFEPFRQAGQPSTRRHGGLGLGLSIVRHLVQAHGGTVSAGPGSEGRGTRIKIRLPL